MREPVDIPVLRLPHAVDLPLPRHMSEQAAGMDLLAAVEEVLPLPPGQRRVVPTGIAMALPRGFEGQIRPRSGLAARYGVTLLNTPGTVDADYRGEVKVVLVNFGADTYYIERGQRVAQLVVQALPEVRLKEVNELPPTLRGGGGFGHTGAGGAGDSV